MKLNEKQLRQLIRKEILKESFSPMKSIASRPTASILSEDLQATAADFDKKMSDYLNALADNPEKANAMDDDIDGMFDQFQKEMEQSLEIARKNAEDFRKKLGLPESYSKKKIDEIDSVGFDRAMGGYASFKKINGIVRMMETLYNGVVLEATNDGADEAMAESMGVSVVLDTAAQSLETLGFLAEANIIRELIEGA
jgi:hypothetical protein